MNKDDYDKIKLAAKSFRYSSLEYVEYADVARYDLLENSNMIILLLGYNREAKCYEYIWAANDVETLENSLNCEELFYISFVPNEWIATLLRNGFTIRNAWHDYFLDSLESIATVDEPSIVFLKDSETKDASILTLECKNQSRGFSGQTHEWFDEWLHNNDEIQDTVVLTHRTASGKLTGILCVGLYGHEKPNGPTVWIKEIAVNPKHQNKGIGRKLLLNGLAYGKKMGGKKAFLAVDENNTNAIRLYASVGFVASADDSEITMCKN